MACGEKGSLPKLVNKLGIISNWQRKPRKELAVYDYVDESGTLRFQVVRYEGKQFRQRQPDGPGKHTWYLKEVKKVLLPGSGTGGLPAESIIFIAEGEKDVDALRALGEAAVNGSSRR